MVNGNEPEEFPDEAIRQAAPIIDYIGVLEHESAELGAILSMLSNDAVRRTLTTSEGLLRLFERVNKARDERALRIARIQSLKPDLEAMAQDG